VVVVFQGGDVAFHAVIHMYGDEKYSSVCGWVGDHLFGFSRGPGSAGRGCKHSCWPIRENPNASDEYGGDLFLQGFPLCLLSAGLL
jgi:hypothetical protein